MEGDLADIALSFLPYARNFSSPVFMPAQPRLYANTASLEPAITLWFERLTVSMTANKLAETRLEATELRRAAFMRFGWPYVDGCPPARVAILQRAKPFSLFVLSLSPCLPGSPDPCGSNCSACPP